MFRSKVASCILAVVAFVAVFATLALAHEGATGVVKERMDLMDRQKDDMKVIGDMVKGKTKFDSAKAAKAAHDLAATTKKIPKLFPEGSDGHPSEALPAVWTEWESFVEDAKDAEAAAKALAAMLDGASSENWKDGFKTMVDACKSCHETFRAEDE